MNNLAYVWSVLVAVAVGGLTSIQSAINTRLGSYIGSVEAALTSFLVGTLALAVMIIPYGSGKINQVWHTQWYLFIGGLLGASFVFSMIKIVPILGTGTAIAGVIAGQLILAVVIDHFGWLGLNTIKIDIYRVMGILFLMLGVKLISK